MKEPAGVERTLRINLLNLMADPNLAVRTGDDELRHRRPQTLPPDGSGDQTDNETKTPRSDDEDDVDAVEARLEKIRELLPQGSDSMGSFVDTNLSGLTPKWRNWVVRGLFTIFMIGGFVLFVRKGATWLMFLVFIIQLKCFHEIIKIALYVYRLYDLPWFRALSWYFLITSDYFLFGESLIDYWSIVLRKDEFLRGLVVHHRMVSFILYILGFVWFVLSLRKGLYLRQFSLFAFTHVVLLLIVSQSFLLVNNLLQGLIWFLAPVSMVICCDIMSYVFGFFFGKTPLIKLSPKKTWEGFIGGAVSTVVFALLLATYMMDKPFFVCPIESYYENDDHNCTFPLAFQKADYAVPRQFSFVFKLLRREPVLRLEPFLIHSVVLALFASLIAPFGGFFCVRIQTGVQNQRFRRHNPGSRWTDGSFRLSIAYGLLRLCVFALIPTISKLEQNRPTDSVVAGGRAVGHLRRFKAAANRKRFTRELITR
ncbi:Phosphatidate cytidylyltransferase [Aphelenchoides besseyi]|nr:Phosphatidate cytidylyltransferase [Aphelenchoides besseyi]